MNFLRPAFAVGLLLVFYQIPSNVIGQHLIGYYSGNAKTVGEYPIEKLSEVIFSFCHLRGNRLVVVGRQDSLTIRELVRIKKKNPGLKVVLSLGGWGGCKTCSTVFSSDSGRKDFSLSVKQTLDFFNADGIDIDWEFPSLPAYPGFPYSAEDKNNLTALVKQLRTVLGSTKQISLLCAGFSPYLEGSVSYSDLSPFVDRFDMMTYDLIGSRVHNSGHHSSLYSTPWQESSADHAVRHLDSLHIPHNKISIGVAFYARLYKLQNPSATGLNQPADFQKFVPMKQVRKFYTEAQGYKTFWDSTACAPYRYNASNGMYLTYDNERSVAEKIKYMRKEKLDGIFFWELRLDVPHQGLLDTLLKNMRP
jgi:chitinase